MTGDRDWWRRGVAGASYPAGTEVGLWLAVLVVGVLLMVGAAWAFGALTSARAGACGQAPASTLPGWRGGLSW